MPDGHAGDSPPPYADAGDSPPPYADAGDSPPPYADAGDSPPPYAHAGDSPPPNAYITDPSRVQHGMREMEKIAAAAQEMLREFEAGVAATRGWTGEGDSFAKEIGPRVEMEDEASGATIRSVAEAIRAVVDAVERNVSSIGFHQAGVADAIQAEARKSSGLGRR